ncbi:hypothetical protein Cantr_01691 [Candida viswanathii]|uniref:Dynactin subunit 4 n=1 Tax=Candida viswanathii TaxID=5486 RepID=A0A367YJJ4_9ASCO|nr:hypothetical protein Cantr_01691 [Candida viswanathii]
MSRIYNDSFIYCCSDPPLDLTLTASINPNFLHPLSDLYFCPICQYPKSKYQTFAKISYKFCSQCLTNYTRNDHITRCSKNCFMCPQCDSNLKIKMNDCDDNGKSFSFDCAFCEFAYETKVVYKPRSLVSIIKDEKMDDGFHGFCEDIRNGVLSGDHHPNQSEQTRKNLQLMLKKNLSTPTTTNSPADKKQYPVSKPLTTKKTLRCLDCNNLVFAPQVEPHNNVPPTINKFQVKFNAVDYMPTVIMSKILNDTRPWNHHTQVMLIHFINPLSVKVHLNISIPSELNHAVKLTIPINEFTLGGANPKNTGGIIKNIPTALLTTNTIISKSELILRKGDVAFKPASSVEEIEENLDDYIEKGGNWYSIPIIITNQPVDGTPLKIPVHVSLSSDLVPDSLKKITNKFSLGYWNILEVNTHK